MANAKKALRTALSYTDDFRSLKKVGKLFYRVVAQQTAKRLQRDKQVNWIHVRGGAQDSPVLGLSDIDYNLSLNKVNLGILLELRCQYRSLKRKVPLLGELLAASQRSWTMSERAFTGIHLFTLANQREVFSAEVRFSAAFPYFLWAIDERRKGEDRFHDMRVERALKKTLKLLGIIEVAARPLMDQVFEALDRTAKEFANPSTDIAVKTQSTAPSLYRFASLEDLPTEASELPQGVLWKGPLQKCGQLFERLKSLRIKYVPLTPAMENALRAGWGGWGLRQPFPSISFEGHLSRAAVLERVRNHTFVALGQIIAAPETELRESLKSLIAKTRVLNKDRSRASEGLSDQIDEEPLHRWSRLDESIEEWNDLCGWEPCHESGESVHSM